MLFPAVLHSPHSATVLFFPIKAMLKKKVFSYLNPTLSNKPQKSIWLYNSYAARRRTPTAELHYTDLQVPKAKPELILAMNSKAIPNSNGTEELLWRK